MNDMAARSLQNALKEKLVFDDEKKEMIYALGVVLEKMGKKEEVHGPIQTDLRGGFRFKDVAKKVETTYSGGHDPN